DVCGSWHFRLQLDHLAIHSEPAASAMVDGFWILLRRIGPGLEHLKDEEIVLVDETGICHLAFEIGKTLCHQRRYHALGWRRSQAEFLELPRLRRRAVPTPHDLGGQLQRRTANHALFRTRHAANP